MVYYIIAFFIAAFFIALLFKKEKKEIETREQKIKLFNLKENEKNLEIKIDKRTQKLKSTIETLKQTQDKLIHAEKMSALGGLVAGISHEINTPIGLILTGITHFLDITKVINKNYEKNNLSQNEFENYIQDSQALAKTIFLNLKRSAELVQNFKQISVDQTSELKRHFNLRQYTEDILISLTNITKKRDISFQLDCEDIDVDS